MRTYFYYFYYLCVYYKCACFGCASLSLCQVGSIFSDEMLCHQRVYVDGFLFTFFQTCSHSFIRVVMLGSNKNAHVRCVSRVGFLFLFDLSAVLLLFGDFNNHICTLYTQQLNEVCYSCTKLNNITHHNHDSGSHIALQRYGRSSCHHQWKRNLNRVYFVWTLFLFTISVWLADWLDGRGRWCVVLWLLAMRPSISTDRWDRESPIFSQWVFSLWPQINSHIHRAHKCAALHNEPCG